MNPFAKGFRDASRQMGISDEVSYEILKQAAETPAVGDMLKTLPTEEAQAQAPQNPPQQAQGQPLPFDPAQAEQMLQSMPPEVIQQLISQAQQQGAQYAPPQQGVA